MQITFIVLFCHHGSKIIVDPFFTIILLIFLYILFHSIYSMHTLFIKLDYHKCRFLWCFVNIALEAYCLLQYLHVNLTPSCTVLLC